MEAGLVFLIRWAMDEQIDVIYMTAIECLGNLIAPKKDEVEQWRNGDELNVSSRRCCLERIIGRVVTISLC